MSNGTIDRTLNYLELIGRQYQIVDYSFTPVGSLTRKRICPSNPMRVALYIQANAAAASWPFFLTTNNTSGFLPREGSAADWYMTIQKHLILPTLEIWYVDNGGAGIQSAWGIIKTGGS